MTKCLKCGVEMHTDELTLNGKCPICGNPCTFFHKGYTFGIEDKLYLKAAGHSIGEMAMIITKAEYDKNLKDSNLK